MRSRRNEPRDTAISCELEYEEKKEKYPSQSVPYYYGIIFLIFLLSLFGLVVFIDNKLPNPSYQKDEANYPQKFIAQRAQEDLKYLTDLGPRVVGSYENEVITVAFLKKRITDIMREADSSQKIELDVQVTSGSYFLESKPTGKINIYANVQNVIAKLHGTDSNNSLLLNSHFDSVPTSPGGGDDGINCAAMVEILRKLSKRKTRLRYSVVFLFNGAEESGLQASHGFISKHKWAPESRVLLNFEAGGSGGKEILFQTGPNRPWLTEVYKSVPHPKGQSILEELFQTNVIPSDDDFRIFRDFGDMVGLDMAFVKDSYRYHNKFDGFQNIPLGSYQHVGDNVMVLIEKIANNPELANDSPKIGKMVYYDILGFFFISYSVSTASVMSGIVIVISLLIFLISLKRFSFGINLKTLGYLIKIITAPICGMVTTLLTVIIGVYIFDSLGYSMRWYRYPWLVIGDFIIPIILISTPFLLLVKPKNISQNAHSFLQAQIIRVIWTSLLVVGTLLGIRSIHPIFLIVLFDTLAFLVILSFHLEKKVLLWKIIYIMFSIIPVIINMSTFYDILDFFIPLTGRIGNFKMPDMIIGLGTLVMGFIILTPYFSLILILKKPANFYKIVLCIYGICLLSIFTPLRFPYSGDVNSPTPQRFWILHSQRIIHDENGGIVKHESGYFFMNMDRNSPKSVKAYVDDLNNAVDIAEDCRNFLMCGLPIAHPKMSDFIKFSSWIPVPVPPILPNPQVDLLVNSKIRISSNVTRYNLTIHGTDHSMFFVSPKEKFKLVNMNFLDELPKEDNLWNGRPYYFFVYTCGKNIDPLHAIFDIEGPDNFEGSTMDFAIVGNYVHPKIFTNTASFSEFLSKFPDWTDLTTWVAIYRSWVI